MATNEAPTLPIAENPFVVNCDKANGVHVQIPDNLVMRKLLRGPRYFDPPDTGSWETCPSSQRKKTCFLCGSLEHLAKECQKDCYISEKRKNRAKKCPQKNINGPENDKICLKCLCSGHDMWSCNYNYSLEDLKEIQCYVCKSFGHLCCANFVITSSRPPSCYKCGELGHTALDFAGNNQPAVEILKIAGWSTEVIECSGLGREDLSKVSPSSCYKCVEGLHTKHQCMRSAKKKRKREIKKKRAAKKQRLKTTDKASPGSCIKFGGLSARKCSSSIQAPSKKVCKESKNQFDQGKSIISRQTAHPGHFPDRGYGNIHWQFPLASSMPIASAATPSMPITSAAGHFGYNAIPSAISPAWALAPTGQHHNSFHGIPPRQHHNYFPTIPSRQHFNNVCATPSGQQHNNYRWAHEAPNTSMLRSSNQNPYNFIPPGTSSVWTSAATRQNLNNFPATPPGQHRNNFRWACETQSGQHHNNLSGGSHVSSSESSHTGYFKFLASSYGNHFGH
ncbi:hypothetical protein ACFE04_015104 [Oxalis oulophora]